MQLVFILKLLLSTRECNINNHDEIDIMLFCYYQIAINNFVVHSLKHIMHNCLGMLQLISLQQKWVSRFRKVNNTFSL